VSKRVLVVEEAEAELVAAVGWYDAQLPGLGAELRDSIDNALRKLVERLVAAAPVAGVSPAIRAKRMFVERFPYAVVFVERDGDLLVLASAHHHRRPGYWRNRGSSA
jgi:hypothetical protein